MAYLVLFLLLCIEFGYGYPTTCSVDPLSSLVRNAALKKPATQIHTYWYMGSASRAVDGKNITVHSHGSCMHTDHGLNSPYLWWMVDLETEYLIQTVSITNRLEFADRLRDFDVFVSLNKTFDATDHMTNDVLCYHVMDKMGPGENRTFSCQNSPLFGHFVHVYMATPYGRPMHFCELSVEGYPASCTEQIQTMPSPPSTTSTLAAQSTLPDDIETISVSMVTSNLTSTNASTNAIFTATSTQMLKSIEQDIVETTLDTTSISFASVHVATSDVKESSVSMATSTQLSFQDSNATSEIPCPCGCVGGNANTTNLTMEELVELVKGLKRELSVNRKETSVYHRKLISVGDKRKSAQAIGVIGGLALCVPVIVIVAFGLINLWSVGDQKKNKVRPK